MMNWWDVLKFELKQIFIKDPRRFIFLFGASLAYLVLFSLLYGTHTINSIPLIIYDEDRTTLSRAMSQSFMDSARFKVVAFVNSQNEMEEYLREKKAYVAIDIPKDFAKNIKYSLASQVLVIANSSNIAIASNAMIESQEIIPQFSQGLGAHLAEWNGQIPDIALHKVAPVQLRMRLLNNPTLSYLDFFVLGLAMAALQEGLMLSVGAGMIYEYQNISRFCNANPLQVLLGKLFPYWILGTLAYLMTAEVAVGVFNLPFKGSFISLLLLGMAFTFTVTGLASLIAAFCQTEVSFTQIALSYAVPAFIFSGYTWPLQGMDTFSQILAHTFPLFYTGNTLRKIMVAGYAPELYRHVLALFVLGGIFLALSILIYVKKRAIKVAI